MKRISFAAMAAIALFTITSCQKNANKVEGDFPPDTTYTISGVTDVNAKTAGVAYTPISVTRNGNTERKISLSVEGLPGNIGWEFSNESGYPDFTSNLRLDMMFVAPGRYPFTIITTPEDGGKPKRYSSVAKVERMTAMECGQFFLNGIGAGTAPGYLITKNTQGKTVYSNTSFYGNLNNDSFKIGVYNMLMEYNEDPSLMYIANIGGQSVVNAVVSCDDGSVTIPVQTIYARAYGGSPVKEYTISGSGKIDALNESFNLTYTSEGGTYTLVSSFKYK